MVPASAKADARPKAQQPRLGSRAPRGTPELTRLWEMRSLASLWMTSEGVGMTRGRYGMTGMARLGAPVCA